MANRPRGRKRVHAIRRAPDGSAFEKCDNCGELVAIALADMHECRWKEHLKRSKSQYGIQNLKKRRFDDQPRSAFCFFMESFAKTCEKEDWIDIDRKGFETWKNMSKEERQIYVFQAEKVNLAYQDALLKEMDNMSEVNDEADSAMVGKFDQFYEDHIDLENSDSFESFFSKRIESFNTYDWKMVYS